MSRYVLAGCVAVLVGLAVHNVGWAVHNQRGKDCGYTVCVGPRTVRAMAWRNRHPVVKGRVSNYFGLRGKLPGKTVEIPPWLQVGQWELENIARMHVVPVDDLRLIEVRHVDALREQATSKYRWLARRKGRRGKWRDLYVIASDGDGPYVVAETGHALGPAFIMRASAYAAVARREDGK